jgi:RHS repeat-associated protein
MTTATVAGATETYAYDGNGVRFTRQIGANQPIRYVSDVYSSLPVTIDDGTRQYVHGIGLAFAVNGSAVEVYHTDRLASVPAITDASASVTAAYRSDEYGLPAASFGSSTQPFGFTGEPRDATGLSYLRARYYDPSLGRFMSRDTWGGFGAAQASLNRCAYARDNPTTLVDPSGRSSSSRALDPNRAYNYGECLAGILGFGGLELSVAVFEAAGLGLQGASITIFGMTLGASTPVSALGVGVGGVMETAGAAISVGGVVLLAKTCAAQ